MSKQVNIITAQSVKKKYILERYVFSQLRAGVFITRIAIIKNIVILGYTHPQMKDQNKL